LTWFPPSVRRAVWAGIQRPIRRLAPQGALGMMGPMKRATLLHHEKRAYDDGAIVEMRPWGVPEPVLGSTRRLKYSLFYGRCGQRLIGYDNERGKGDHRHFDGDQERCSFVSVRRLMAGFLADMDALRKNK